MINLIGCSDEALSDAVLSDIYFTVELDNIPFLLALVTEEFIYTSEQHAVLVSKLGGTL